MSSSIVLRVSKFRQQLLLIPVGCHLLFVQLPDTAVAEPRIIILPGVRLRQSADAYSGLARRLRLTLTTIIYRSFFLFVPGLASVFPS